MTLRTTVVGFWIASCAIVLWAVAAGTWRALRVSASDKLWGLDGALLGQFLARGAGALFFSAGALATAVLIVLASLVFGGILGFLFGLPRQAPGGTPATPAPPATSGGTASSNNGGGPAPAATPADFAMSPALVEIADWLTKIIVGIGLVELDRIRQTFSSVVDMFLGPGGMGRFPGGGVVVPALIIIGLIGGFIAAYLATALALGRELADVALDLLNLKSQRDAAERRAVEARKNADEARKSEALQQAILRLRSFNIARMLASASPDIDGSVTDQDRSDATLLAAQSLDKLDGVDQLRAWSKAQAIRGNLDGAIDGYRKLEAMQEKLPRDAREALLDEAERVNRKAGRTNDANQLQETQKILSQTRSLSHTLRPTGLPEVLYQQFPDDDARLAAMQNIIKIVGNLHDHEAADFVADGQLQLWYACALGQAHAILVKRGLGQTAEAHDYQQKAKAAIVEALDKKQPRDFLQLLMDPNDPRKRGQPLSEREDDLESFYPIQEMKDLVFPP